MSPTVGLTPEAFPDVAALRNLWGAHEVTVRAHLDSVGEEGLARVIEYRMLNGQPGESVFCHMLQHVVNHGTYHRGQVTTMLRQLGAAPPKSVDLIAFYRTRVARG